MFNPYKLRTLRKSSRQEQIVIAEYLGISRSTYSGYETGRIQPSVDVVLLLSDMFNVSLDYLYDKTSFPIRLSEFSSDDVIIFRAIKACDMVTKAYVLKILNLYEETF